VKKLRILFAGYLPPHNGGSATVHGLILKALLARGHSLRVIAPITPSDAETGDWFAAANPTLDITRFQVPFFISATTTAHPLELEEQRITFGRLISNECTRQRPDVLLLGDIVVARPGKALGPAGVCSAMFVHGGALYLLRRNTEPAQELADIFDCYRRADHLLAVAVHQGPYLDELGLTRYSIIPNVIDTQQYKPREKNKALLAQLGIAADDFVVAHFSNLRSVKRPLDLVEAAAIALRRDPRLLFVVSGSGELREDVEHRCRELAIADRFRFPGWIRNDRMTDYYSISDAVAMPSESEGRSMVHLETQASGRVLIASDIPASREIVRDGVTGMLFPRGSAEALAECIVNAAASNAVRETIGRQARAAVEEHSLDAYGISMEQVLMALVEQSRSRSVDAKSDRQHPGR
jgi:glycosyltransferase involved in cell wall biosynthesis